MKCLNRLNELVLQRKTSNEHNLTNHDNHFVLQ